MQKSINSANIFETDTCFFCISDSINPKIDYKAIGNVIKNKISNHFKHRRPGSIFKKHLEKFKNANSLTFDCLYTLLFDDNEFPRNDMIKKALALKRDDFVKNIRENIEEEIIKLYLKGNEEVEIMYLKAHKELDNINYNDWFLFLSDYIDSFVNDTTGYIFLQLNKNNYKLVENNFLTRGSSKKCFLYKISIEEMYRYYFFSFSPLENDLCTSFSKCSINSKKKPSDKTKISTFPKNKETDLQSLFKSLVIEDENHESKLDTNPQNNWRCNKKSIYKKIVVLNLSKGEIRSLIELLSIKMQDNVIEHKFLYRICTVSNIDESEMLNQIKIDFRNIIFGCQLYNGCKIEPKLPYYCYKPFEIIKKIVESFNIYISKNPHRYDKFIVTNDNFIVYQSGISSIEHIDKMNIFEECMIDDNLSYEFSYIDFDIRQKTYKTSFNILFFSKYKCDKEICVLKFDIYRKVLINETVHLALNLFEASFKAISHSYPSPTIQYLYDKYLTPYSFLKSFLKPKTFFIDNECNKIISDIMHDCSVRKDKIKKICIFFANNAIDKWYEEKLEEKKRTNAGIDFNLVQSFRKEYLDFKKKIIEEIKNRTDDFLVFFRFCPELDIKAYFLSDKTISKVEIFSEFERMRKFI